MAGHPDDNATLVTDTSLILEEDSSEDDGGATLVQDREGDAERTVMIGDPRLARMQAIQQAARPFPAAGAAHQAPAAPYGNAPQHSPPQRAPQQHAQQHAGYQQPAAHAQQAYAQRAYPQQAHAQQARAPQPHAAQAHAYPQPYAQPPQAHAPQAYAAPQHHEPPQQPEQEPEADPERRMLPFAMNAAMVSQHPSYRPPPARQSSAPPAVSGPVGVPQTPAESAHQPRVALASHVAPSAASIAAPVTEPLADALPSKAPPAIIVHGPATSAPATSAPARAPHDSMVTQPQGTPPLVIRFLAVCGVLTAAGLAALIYLEI
jgi:hypothetical protein